jgi:type IV secretory pathway TraG/TraD family ATPase VirD4
LLLASSKIEKSERKNIYNRMLIGFLFFSNLFFFFKMPVIRYHHTLFILFILSFIFLINVTFIKKNTIFNSIVIIFFAVNLSKNLTRIYQNNFINNPIEHLKEIKWYQESKKKKLSDFIYYNGWIGGYPIGNMSLDKYNHIKLFYDIIYKQNYNFKF